MMHILTKKDDILMAQNSLLEALHLSFNQSIAGTVNCLGGKFSADLSYSEALDMWYFYQQDEKKHWNAFGLGRPSHKGLRIYSELNVPASGLNRAMAAAFALDKKEQLYLLHRGKIRGGKDLFFKHFTGQSVMAHDGERDEQFALIASFAAGAVAEQTAQFVQQVVHIKEQAKK